jgi:cytochrome c-type biogenesis protein CcmH/NrfF
MKPLRRLRFAILLVACLTLAGEVTTTDPMILQMREVGKNVKCQCGCQYTVADCNMLNCHFREPINEEIQEGLEAGLSPEVILAQLFEKYGSEIRTAPAAEGFGRIGWAMPFVAVAFGLALAPIVIRRWKRKQALRQEGPEKPAVDEDSVRRFEAEIEKSLAEDD